MIKKIFPSVLLILTATLLVMGIFTYHNTKGLYYDFVEDGLNRALTAIEGSILDSEDFYDPSENLMIRHTMESSDYRITLIDEEGRVVFDTDRDAETMQNHADRPEILDALSGNPTRSVRYSESIGADMMYKAVAMELDDGSTGILRVSMKLSLTRDILTMSLRELAVYLFFAFAAAALFSRYLIGYMLRPVKDISFFAKKIAGGDYEERMSWYANDEIGDLATSLNDMADRLEETFQMLSNRNVELEVILKSILDGIIAVDPTYHIKIINNSALQLLGVDPNRHWVGKNLREILPKDSLFREMDDVYAKDGDESVYYKEVKIGDKTVRVAYGKINDNDQVNGYILVLQDITQIRRLENIRKDFVANVSHELKTPITSIKGFVETLREGVDDEATRNHFYDIIEMETQRLIELVEDILTLSFLENEESGREGVEDRIHPGVVLREMIQMASKLAREKDIRIESQIQSDLPEIPFKEEYFRQMCLNLLDNAVKYSPPASKVWVTLKREEKYLKLIIADQGMGIPEEAKERIFERFYRVEKGRGRKEGGTGLGLAIVKHIVQSQGATITVDSEPGKGSTFTVTIEIVRY
ncbi:HAMP domain-containing protein [Alkalibacter rhizosphaerae]|uniref:histidine kinase n=1 Tax=Alkalibacter rhizosphaerae TaxID=2815577 RepID=A0A975AHS9_9FIRM|nr:ATP-binding protein [Alkalibacter rhizosphaerae]QSX08767.1 HAMP domain-containing protein [Alkalibacter rhizosphaerae]